MNMSISLIDIMSDFHNQMTLNDVHFPFKAIMLSD